MTATLHLGVRNALANLLLAPTALAGGRIHQNRDYALNQEEASAISVYRRQSVAERWAIDGGPVDWLTEIEVLIKARTVTGTTAEVAADGLCSDVYARVMAAPTLGGLAMDTQPPGAIVWDQDEADANVATCTMTFTVLHRTAGNAIT